MAINLRLRYIKSIHSSKQIILEDHTGIDAGDGSNGGYGLSAQAANLSKLEADQEIDGWDFLVTRPDGSTINLDSEIDDIQFDNVNQIIQISITDTQELQDGLWTFKMDVNEDGGQLDTVTVEQYIVNLDSIKTSINTKVAKELDFCNLPSCGCNKGLLTLWSYYRALEAALEEENSVQIDFLLIEIKKLL